ncbi:hypothetical protein KJ855_03790 [Patescibacteria group bacterium]|nr:hypothetical protein [Patescibacteria group bacterium]
MLVVMLTGTCFSEEKVINERPWENEPTMFTVEQQKAFLNLAGAVLEPWCNMLKNTNKIDHEITLAMLFPGNMEIVDRVKNKECDAIYWLKNDIVYQYMLCQDDVTGSLILWGPLLMQLDKPYKAYVYYFEWQGLMVEMHIYDDNCRNICIRYYPLPPRIEDPNEPPSPPPPPVPKMSYFIWQPTVTGWVIAKKVGYTVKFSITKDQRTEAPGHYFVPRNSAYINAQEIEDNDSFNMSQDQYQNNLNWWEQYINFDVNDPNSCGPPPSGGHHDPPGEAIPGPPDYRSLYEIIYRK